MESPPISGGYQFKLRPNDVEMFRRRDAIVYAGCCDRYLPVCHISNMSTWADGCCEPELII